MSTSATSNAPWEIDLNIKAGEHVIALMSNRRDVEVLAPYLRNTVPVSNPGVVVAAPSQQDEAAHALMDAGVGCGSNIHFHDPLEMGVRDGHFDADHFLTNTGKEMGKLIEQGASRIHHSGIMRWVNDAQVSESECIYLEARINQEIEGSCMSGMCIYDVAHIGSHLLVQLLRTHPKVLMDDRIVENPFYERPEEVIRQLGRTA